MVKINQFGSRFEDNSVEQNVSIYKYIYTVDIKKLLGFIFRRVHNKFHLGCFIVVYI